MKKILTAVAVAVALATPAHATEAQMPKTLIGRWCWEPPTTKSSNPNLLIGTYHRCDELGGGEDFEFKKHGMMDEGTLGGDDWHLTRVSHEPNIYVLEFASGEHRNRVLVSVNPILNHQITVNWLNDNFGKADDVGSERFSVINQCFIAKAKSIDTCMAKSGYVFCPECQIFGNDGPRCKNDDPLHSWCWVQDSGGRRICCGTQ
jgi:hypothetical protein